MALLWLWVTLGSSKWMTTLVPQSASTFTMGTLSCRLLDTPSLKDQQSRGCKEDLSRPILLCMKVTWPWNQWGCKQIMLGKSIEPPRNTRVGCKGQTRLCFVECRFRSPESSLLFATAFFCLELQLLIAFLAAALSSSDNYQIAFVLLGVLLLNCNNILLFLNLKAMAS